VPGGALRLIGDANDYLARACRAAAIIARPPENVASRGRRATSSPATSSSTAPPPGRPSFVGARWARLLFVTRGPWPWSRVSGPRLRVHDRRRVWCWFHRRNFGAGMSGASPTCTTPTYLRRPGQPRHGELESLDAEGPPVAGRHRGRITPRRLDGGERLVASWGVPLKQFREGHAP